MSEMNEQATQISGTPFGFVAVAVEVYGALMAWRAVDRKKTRVRLQRALWAVYDYFQV